MVHISVGVKGGGSTTVVQSSAQELTSRNEVEGFEVHYEAIISQNNPAVFVKPAECMLHTKPDSILLL
jgi:hypothetical protein